jgi:hypothetical protein
MRTLHTIDCSEARKVVDLVVAEALQKRTAAAVAVADAHGDLGPPHASASPPGKSETRSSILKGAMTSLTTAIQNTLAGAVASRFGRMAK